MWSCIPESGLAAFGDGGHVRAVKNRAASSLNAVSDGWRARRMLKGEGLETETCHIKGLARSNQHPAGQRNAAIISMVAACA